MAADILLYDADKVPVGDDQRQHLELTRDLAIRFNNRYGETFVVPEAGRAEGGGPGHGPPASGAQDVEVGDVAARDDRLVGRVRTRSASKVRKAVTDTDGEVRYDPDKKPGVSNLLELLAAASSRLDRRRWPASYDRLRPAQGRPRRSPGGGAGAGAERYAEITRGSRDGRLGLLEEGAAQGERGRVGDPRPATDAIGLLAPPRLSGVWRSGRGTLSERTR